MNKKFVITLIIIFMLAMLANVANANAYIPFVANGEQSVIGTLPGTVPPTITDIAFVGNSITVSDSPGQWGMAATQPDRDYVHRVQLRLAAHTGIIPEITVYSADFHTPERIALAAQRIATAPPRVIVVQMGDNAPTNSIYETFRDAYTLLRNTAPSAKLIYVGVWQFDDMRNNHIMRIAKEDGASFVWVHDLYLDPANQAAAQGCTDTNGVCWHPSDAGMALIAGRVYSAILAPPRADYLP